MIELQEAVSIIEEEINAKCIDGLETENYFIFQLDMDKPTDNARLGVNKNTGTVEWLNIMQLTLEMNKWYRAIEL